MFTQQQKRRENLSVQKRDNKGIKKKNNKTNHFKQKTDLSNTNIRALKTICCGIKNVLCFFSNVLWNAIKRG